MNELLSCGCLPVSLDCLCCGDAFSGFACGGLTVIVLACVCFRFECILVVLLYLSWGLY